MEIILLERVEKLGQMGDVVKVKPGYARNFLLPQGKALRANKNNLERFETEKASVKLTTCPAVARQRPKPARWTASPSAWFAQHRKWVSSSDPLPRAISPRR